jgi:hypothetical protein
MITTASINTLTTALAMVNDQYDGNIIFREVKQISAKRVQFTLRTKNSRAPGSRLNFQLKRHLPCACWHVHGNFFEAVLKLDSSALIISGGKMRITKDGGNWTDYQIGSMFQPTMASEACECGL